jgi:hypothetical protein
MPGISDPPTLHLAQRSANGASWSSNGTHAAGTGTVFLPIVNRTGMTALGQYGIISGSSNVLPIELLYFRANWNNYQVDLTWATATETNNDHFVIERSLNGEDFTGVLEIAGRGTTTQASYYSASDKKPFTGRSYYRLKQVDHDGSYSYSDVKVVNSPWMSTGNTPLEVSRVYPNPCADNFHVTYRSATGKPVRVSLYNLEGKLMHEDEWETTTQGMVEEMIDMHTMPHGTYFLSLQSGDERISKRIIRL